MYKRGCFLCFILYLPVLQAKELSIEDLIKMPFAQLYKMRTKPANHKAAKQKAKVAKKSKSVQK